MKRPALILLVAVAVTGCHINLIPRLRGGPTPEIRFLEGVLRANPKNEHAWFLLGKESLERGDYKDARAAFAQALRLKPALREAEYGIALAYLSESDWSHAAREYTRLTARTPEVAAAWEGLAVAELGRGKLDAAEKAANKAKELDSASYRAQAVLGKVAYTRGNYQQALSHWDTGAMAEEESATLAPVVEDLREFLDTYHPQTAASPTAP